MYGSTPCFFFPQGEWLAFTARAEESSFWDVGASIASGLNGTSVEFRVLVNATNCSTPDTDGFDGLGDLGVDLLNGPLLGGYTGSWEAFEMIVKEEVYVPEGTHRFLFCADDGVFNLNFLRVWVPEPTLAPTMAPTPAPTPAPVAPSDDGFDTKWIYIGVRVNSLFIWSNRFKLVHFCCSIRCFVGALCAFISWLWCDLFGGNRFKLVNLWFDSVFCGRCVCLFLVVA